MDHAVVTVRSALVLVALVTACAHSRPRALEVQILLNPPLASVNGVGALAPDFDLSPERLLVLADARHVYVVGWGGVAPVEGLIGGAGSLAYTADGLLLVVRGTELAYLGESGALETFFELPHAGMALATGPADVMYLFDRDGAGDGGAYGLYQLRPGRQVVELLESPRPIDSVASAGARLFLATGGSVFEATPGKAMRLVASLTGASLRWVAADEATGTVYVSDGAALFSLKGSRVVPVSRTMGGSLRVRGGVLLVLDAAHQMLVRVAVR